MCSRFLSLAASVACLLAGSACSHESTSRGGSTAPQRVLRVCADPNNLPFSNRLTEGFENRIVDVLARDMGARVEYTWFAQRRGFIRNTLDAELCDVVMGVPSSLDSVETTRPYYQSTYVFVTREEDNRLLSSLDDPALKSMRIGIHVVGDDYANPPPAHALGRRNIIANVSGYSIYGDYAQPNPPARLVEAVAERSIDLAIIWGPFGGFFGSRQPTALRVVPVTPGFDPPDLPFVFAISLAVRKGQHALLHELQDILDERKSEIDGILSDYKVPLVSPVEQKVSGNAH